MAEQHIDSKGNRTFSVPCSFIQESDFYCQSCYEFFKDEGELAAHRATPAHLREGSKFCCGVKFREPHLLRKHRETSAHATHKDGLKTEAKAWSAYHRANRAYWTKKP